MFANRTTPIFYHNLCMNSHTHIHEICAQILAFMQSINPLVVAKWKTTANVRNYLQIIDFSKNFGSSIFALFSMLLCSRFYWIHRFSTKTFTIQNMNSSSAMCIMLLFLSMCVLCASINNWIKSLFLLNDSCTVYFHPFLMLFNRNATWFGWFLFYLCWCRKYVYHILMRT